MNLIEGKCKCVCHTLWPELLTGCPLVYAARDASCATGECVYYVFTFTMFTAYRGIIIYFNSARLLSRMLLNLLVYCLCSTITSALF